MQQPALWSEMPLGNVTTKIETFGGICEKGVAGNIKW